MAKRSINLAASIVAALVLMAQTARADESCDDNSGNSPYVCVDWGKPGSPVPDTHFRFDFQTDPDKPGVQFIAGDLGWVVWSQVSEGNTNPDDLGLITIDPEDDELYGVKIANGANPGALDVGGIDLTAQSWTGHSSITGGTIAGTLDGDLNVKASGGSGGSVTLTIEGDLIGNVDVDSIASGGLTPT